MISHLVEPRERALLSGEQDVQHQTQTVDKRCTVVVSYTVTRSETELRIEIEMIQLTLRLPRIDWERCIDSRLPLTAY